jgi:hypothetical protein
MRSVDTRGGIKKISKKIDNRQGGSASRRLGDEGRAPLCALAAVCRGGGLDLLRTGSSLKSAALRRGRVAFWGWFGRRLHCSLISRKKRKN